MAAAFYSRARASIMGGPDYPEIRGLVTFSPAPGGTIVNADIYGLPPFSREEGKLIGPHGFHIHVGDNCEPGTSEDPFPETGGHYNPDDQVHPNHIGDFPVLFSNNGRAHTSFYTNRFSPVDVVGRTVLIHESPDDFRTDPDGASGRKIACGVIRRY